MAKIKQCAGCGSQVASAARECPVCGRGSMTSDLGMIAFLGVLLLGIALASGLVPINRSASQPRATPPQLAAPQRPETTKATSSRQESQAPRPAVAAANRDRHVRTGASVAKAPCVNPDTSAMGTPCEALPGYKSASPDTAPPEASAVDPSSAEPRFYTAYDSIGH